MNPYPTLLQDIHFRRHLDSLGYPRDIVKLLYPQYTETSSRGRLDFEIWLDPGQNTSVGGRRPTGHEVHLYLHNQGLFENTITFHDLRFYEVYPLTIPSEWRQYSFVIAWKGVAYNQYGDLCYPCLCMKDLRPAIRWIPLAFQMNAGEGTLLVKED